LRGRLRAREWQSQIPAGHGQVFIETMDHARLPFAPATQVPKSLPPQLVRQLQDALPVQTSPASGSLVGQPAGVQRGVSTWKMPAEHRATSS
jgi:hypothetical protein